MSLSREQFPHRCDAEHVAVAALVEELTKRGFKAEDTSYHNDTDPSVGVYLGTEDQPAINVWVVGLDSELRDSSDGDDLPPSICFMVWAADRYPGGFYISGDEVWDEAYGTKPCYRVTVNYDELVDTINKLLVAIPAAEENR